MNNTLRIPAPLSLSGNVSDNFRKFKQNFEIYFTALSFEKPDPKVKVAILLNVIGEDAVELFDTFALPDEHRQDFHRVLQAFEDYCIPKKNVVVERFKFNTRIQHEGEPLDNFVTELKKLVKTCEYNNQTDSVLRDRIVLGVFDKSLQESLLRIKDLTLEKTVEFCKTAELSKQQAEVIQNEKHNKAPIHHVEKTRSVVSGNPKESKPVNRWVKQPNKMKNDWSEKAKNTYLCKKCNMVHEFAKCPAYGKKCRNCGKLGHFAVGCKQKKVRSVANNFSSVNGEFVVNKLNAVDSFDSSVHEWSAVLEFENNRKVKFKLDTGAQVNVLPLKIFKQIENKGAVKSSPLVLEAFGGEKIKTVGTVQLKCKSLTAHTCGNETDLNFVLVNNTSAVPLLGLSGCVKLNLIKRIDEVKCDTLSKEVFIEAHKEVFDGNGSFKDECEIVIPEDIHPVVKPPRRVPLGLRERLKEKLDRLVDSKIISEVDNPKSWVSNLVIVEKPDGSLRLCLDPTELNKVIQRQYHLIPTIDDVIAKLSGKSVFSVLDLKDGFYQVPLSKKSRDICCFSTPFGCYQFNRLPFGLSNAPEVFQKMNEKNFSDIKGVCIYFDDLLIAGTDKEHHDEILAKVMQRAQKLNVKFNPKKLQYRVGEVRYLGHIFCKDGMKPDHETVEAVLKLKDPSNKTELQRVLGMINYLRRFVPNMASLTANLRELLKKNISWNWTEVHSKDLQRIKHLISSAPVLGTFNPKAEIKIQCDSSKDGTGCCLMCNDQPIAFASRSLTDAEKNYSQVEKELLSIVVATQKFHHFIYGHEVNVQTDHKPLVSIMTKNVADVHSSRLQRMKMKLLKYNLNVSYLPGKQMLIADLLSRSYLETSVEDDPDLTEIVHILSKNLQMSEDKKKVFRTETAKDPVLSLVLKMCQEGWPENPKNVPEKVGFYYKMGSQLCVEEGILFIDDKVVVPSSLRKEMLKLLHESHFGMMKTKARARQVIYWPGINKDIENMISQCTTCERYRPQTVKEPLISHELPSLPFEKIGADILDYGGKAYLAVGCYLTKWLELVPLKNKTADHLIDVFKPIFATHGIPKVLICDNVPFSSWNMHQFAKEWNFKIVTSSPRYPKSNGFSESLVGIAKGILRKAGENRIQEALLEYRSTPVIGVDVSPCQMLFSRSLRTKLPATEKALRPKVQEGYREKLLVKQQNSKFYYDKHAHSRPDFEEGERVLIRNGNVWEPGVIIEKHQTPRSYMVRNSRGNIIRRNKAHLRKSKRSFVPKSPLLEADVFPEQPDPDDESEVLPDRSQLGSTVTTRSGRRVRPPDRLDL